MKKLLSLWIVVAMMVTLLPTDLVKADTVSDVELAKGYIDAIVEAAPTVEDYVFTEQLAEQVDGLERVLRDITKSSDIEVLDAYVAEKTTVVLEPEVTEEPSVNTTPETSPEATVEPLQVTHTYFTSVQEFSLAYSDAQKVALKSLTEPITKAIQNLLSVPLTKENYQLAQDKYDEASKHIRDAVASDDVNALNQIHELITLMERADTAFSRIKVPTKNSNVDDFEFFMEDFQRAKTAYGLYDSKYANLKVKFYVCLQKDIKNKLLDNYDIYAKATLHAEVEKAYDDLGVYDSFTDTVKEKMEVLKDAVDAGQVSKFGISVYDYYRGEDIQFVLDEYKHLTELEEMMALISDTPANKTELTAALRAYRYYHEDLTDKERELVPADYVVKLNQAVLLNTNTEEVMSAIADIGKATSEEDYQDFLMRYDKAYKAYRLFVNTYSGLSDIPSLITNVATLDDSTEVVEMIKSIRQIESTEDALMCSKRLQMESVLNGYERMSTEKQEAVFNIEKLRTIYADASAASALRSKIDVIINNHSLLDEQYVATIHGDYDKLSETAKRYLGNDYVKKIQSIDRDIEALNLNKALRVSTLINRIGKVDVKAKETIARARDAYNELTEIQKTFVPNYNILAEAETAYAALELSVAKATVSALGSFPYSGFALTPAINVQLNGETLTQDLDYRLVYSSNVNIGTAKVVIYGMGAYTGSLTKTFTIRPCAITGVSLSGFANKYSYTGKTIRPLVKASLNGKVLKKGTDYLVSYKNNKKRGTATITVTGVGNYIGSAQAFFTINRNSIKNAKVSGVKKVYRKTGKAIKPKVKVKVSGLTLKKKRDYKVTYKKNKKRGTATITIKGMGNYTGSKKIKFKII